LTNTTKLQDEWVDIIIPTFDNLRQLRQCIGSMRMTRNNYSMKFIIVNNGKAPLHDMLEEDGIKVVTPPTNLGWTGGLKYGLEHSNSKYVLFANDDIYVPLSSHKWLRDMVRVLSVHENCAAVGPSSNCVMGSQNIWSGCSVWAQYVPFLIGFCVLYNREILDKIGGIDDAFYHGDDLELSIRARNQGYNLLHLPTIFIYHHGFQTGEKVHGGPDKPGGWNSDESTRLTNQQLIKKHGFMKFWECRVRPKLDDAQTIKKLEVENILTTYERSDK
jgi:GT2 family glycosyltransferase|tara:strand:+ start:1745 stop:2566 length:822 start_codon:yes stop_codon:yes gene_type:complete